MALALNIVSRTSHSISVLEQQMQKLSLVVFNSKREKHLNPKPRLRNPTWLVRKTRSHTDDPITFENREFIKEIVQDKLVQSNHAIDEIATNNVIWTPNIQRTGVIARKIGVYPLWLKNGSKMQTTLLQILDNHVIKYYTPDNYKPHKEIRPKVYNKKGCILLGAEFGDPSNFTKDYCGLFKESGVLPTKWLARFFVSPEGALPLGATISARHFQVGNYVDVRGKTIDRGFQGVMKRHGFKGMPASHGVTKTHRRGGNIGGGGEKARVWPGTKMPGHMGNTYRVAKGLKVLRLNTKYNVIWVSGQAIPGETNSIVYVYDTKIPTRTPTNPLPLPTLLQQTDEDVPEDIYDESIHVFSDPTIIFNEK
ncbi:mitochondrial ribosomal protein L3 [Rhynchophorus ferrugineus]|uniref:mitochondrial ribosomal protein L3 n=1 Tax=Rhynchophorus ferrugineus TaxID=354439 RepID=UPI003FCEC964